MRKTLIVIETVSFTIAVVALFFVLFVVGDTDLLSERPPWTTAALMAIACAGAGIGGILHWVGLPMNSKPEKANMSAPSPEAEIKSPSK